MNLCNNDHDEVCYEGRHCPVCAVADNKNGEINTLQDRISVLENQIGELEAELEEAREVKP
jgi:hypothetical protein